MDDLTHFREAIETAVAYNGKVRPGGSNADEWAIFLGTHESSRDYIAVQIAEAIDAANFERIAALEAQRDAAQQSATNSLNAAREAARQLRSAEAAMRELVKLIGDLATALDTLKKQEPKIPHG